MESSETEFAGYAAIERQVRALLEGERDAIANAANISAVAFELLPDVNWVGFYFRRGAELVLGPFQGRVACVRIQVGKGVCGTAASEARTQVVADVHAFPGHIACDAASNSELVVPLIHGGEVIGVFDLDSPSHGRFGEVDRVGLEAIASLWLSSSDLLPILAR